MVRCSAVPIFSREGKSHADAGLSRRADQSIPRGAADRSVAPLDVLRGWVRWGNEAVWTGSHVMSATIPAPLREVS